MKVFLQRDYEIIYFDCEERKILKSFKVSNCSCYATNCAEDILLIGTRTGMIMLYNILTSQLIMKEFVSVICSSIISVDMSEDGNTLVYVDSQNVYHYNRITGVKTRFNCIYGDDVALTSKNMIISDDGVIKYISLSSLREFKSYNLRRREIFDLYTDNDTVVMKSMNKLIAYGKTEDISYFDDVQTSDGCTWFAIKDNQCVIWSLKSLIKRTYFCPLEASQIIEIYQYKNDLLYFTDESVYCVNKITGEQTNYCIFPSISVKKHEFADYLYCPITQQIMFDPVTTSDGFTYEARAISKWLKKNMTSPITREELDPHVMVPNKIIKQLISEIII